jgi:hypothetical protein
MYQVGFSLSEYIEMQGQQNIKFSYLSIYSVLFHQPNAQY